jgi:branched-chain amino acid transport system substrate-binding protein
MAANRCSGLCTAGSRAGREKTGAGLRIAAVWGIWACLLILMPQRLWSQEVRPIRIGATVSLSGKYLEPSLMVRDAIKLWESQVNQRGGILGRPVHLILYDDQSRPERVRELYTQLIQKDKVDLVLSPYGTPLTLAASEVTEKHKFFMLAGSASGESVWQQGYKNIFGVYAPARRTLIGFLDLLARSGLESVAIIFEDSPHNISTSLGGLEWANRLGIKVT